MHSDPQRRRQVLDAAERLLRHYGPGKTTMAEIAKEADISVGAVYLEFDSKDAIVEELSRQHYDTVLGAMRTAALDHEGPFAARLGQLFDAKVRTLLRLAEGGLHAVELMHCSRDAVQSSYGKFKEGELELVTTVVQFGLDRGEFAQGEARLLAPCVLRAYASFSPPWLFSQPREELLRALEGMHRLVSQGLVARMAKPYPTPRPEPKAYARAKKPR